MNFSAISRLGISSCSCSHSRSWREPSMIRFSRSTRTVILPSGGQISCSKRKNPSTQVNSRRTTSRKMRLQAGEDIVLGEIAGIDQQQAQFFIGHLGRALFEQLVLPLRNLAGGVQDGSQAAVIRPKLGIGQFSLAKRNASCFPGALNDQQPVFWARLIKFNNWVMVKSKNQ